MDDSLYDLWYNNIPRAGLVGTANVLQSVAFIAEHERSTNIKFFLIDDEPQNFSDKIRFIGREKISEAVRGLDVVFILTALTDEATCKTAHLIADGVKNENVFLSVAVVQSASKEFSDALNYLEKNFKVVINLEEQQFNLPVEDFSYKIVHGIHSVYDNEFYPYVRPVDGDDLVDLLTCGRKTFVSFGEAFGKNPIVAAVNAAIASPLIKKSLQSARSVFLNTMGATDYLSMLEESEASTLVYEATNPDGDIYPAVNLDEALGEKIFVMIFVRV